MMSALGIDVLFSQERITWEGFDLPFKEYRIENIKENFFIPDPEAVASSEDRMGIQTPNYTATQLNDYVSELKYLSSNEQAMLLRLLKHHEEMFDGKLGTWKGTPYHIELQENANRITLARFRFHASMIKPFVKQSKCMYVKVSCGKLTFPNGLRHRISFPRRMVKQDSLPTFAN